MHDLAHLIGHASVALESGLPAAVEAARQSLAGCRALIAADASSADDAGRRCVSLRCLVEKEARQALSARRSGGRLRILQNVPEELQIDDKVALVERVVRNLLLNAMEASHDGGVVRVRGARRGGTLLLEVLDEGRGLDRAARARLYGRAGWEDARGNGAGRESVRACALRLGATVEVDGAPGQGLCVTLRWRPNAARIGLLVDVPAARASLARALVEQGFDVPEEESALELLRGAPPGEQARWIVARGHGALAAEDWKRLEQAACEVRSTLAPPS